MFIFAPYSKILTGVNFVHVNGALVIIFILYIEYSVCLFQLMGAPGPERGWNSDSLLIRQLDITTLVLILNG